MSNFLNKQRKDLIAYGHKIVAYGFGSGTGGNISVFDPESKLVLITPSGMDFMSMTEKDLVIIDLSGKVIEGNKKPSSEWEMHTIFYKNRSDINAVIHIHGIYTTVLSCLRQELLPTHYMIAVAGPSVRVSKYATFGTPEIATNALKAMKDRKAVILANHGLLGGETNLEKAFNVIEEVEYCAKIYYLAQAIGKPIILDNMEMKKMAKKFKDYGKNVKQNN